MIMFTKFSEKLYSRTKGWHIVAFLGGLVAYVGITLPVLQSRPGGDIVALDAQVFYTPTQAFETIASYGDAAGFWALMYLSWDIITPILYSLFFASLITWLFQRGFKPDSSMRKLNVVPIAAGLFDIFENICIAILLVAYPSEPATIAGAATICTVMKVFLLGGSILLVLFGLATTAIRTFKKL